MKLAILVIDMLHEFVYGRLKSERAQKLVPKISKLLNEARKCNIPIIYACDAHYPKIDYEFKKWGPHAIRGSSEARIVNELKPHENDFIILKRRYDAFFATDLDLLLRELGVDTVVLTGIHTHICVLHTAAGAFFRGYRIIVIEDCTDAFSEDAHRMGLQYMKEIYGAELIRLDEFIEKFLSK